MSDEGKLTRPLDGGPSSSSRLRAALRWLGAGDKLPIDPDLAADDPAAPAPGRRPGPPVHRAHPKVLAAIALGGFIGTLGRYVLSVNWPGGPTGFAWAIFAINTSGAFLIGLVVTVIVERFEPNPYLRPFAAVGVLGGWTTMSTLAVGADVLVKNGRGATAALYLVATVVAGLAATSLGIALGRRRPSIAEGL
jgi:fluoride exporter